MYESTYLGTQSSATHRLRGSCQFQTFTPGPVLKVGCKRMQVRLLKRGCAASETQPQSRDVHLSRLSLGQFGAVPFSKIYLQERHHSHNLPRYLACRISFSRISACCRQNDIRTKSALAPDMSPPSKKGRRDDEDEETEGTEDEREESEEGWNDDDDNEDDEDEREEGSNPCHAYVTNTPPRAPKRSRMRSGTPAPVGYIVVHRVVCTDVGRYHEEHDTHADYFDVPRMRAKSNRLHGLCGQDPLDDLENYLDDHFELSFAVCKTYHCVAYHQKIKNDFQRLPMPQMHAATAIQAKPYFYVLKEDAEPARSREETLILSERLEEALEALLGRSKDGSGEKIREGYLSSKIWRNPANLTYPYTELYSRNQTLAEHMTHQLESVDASRIISLSEYLEKRIGPEYEDANAMFERGVVNRKHWAKLFRPDAIVVGQKDGQPQAYTCISCPSMQKNALELECWSWAFDGKFFRSDVTLTVRWSFESDSVPITGLDVYPLEYAQAGLQETLRNRGKVFWSCRSRKFVGYDKPLQGMEIQKVLPSHRETGVLHR
jgi:hypothetical protein